MSHTGHNLGPLYGQGYKKLVLVVKTKSDISFVSFQMIYMMCSERKKVQSSYFDKLILFFVLIMLFIIVYEIEAN